MLIDRTIKPMEKKPEDMSGIWLSKSSSIYERDLILVVSTIHTLKQGFELTLCTVTTEAKCLISHSRSNSRK